MIFDVLTSLPSESGPMEFTANAAVLQVAVTSPGGDNVICVNSAGSPFLEPGDNILLQAISPYIAFGFGQAVGSHKIYMNWVDEDGNQLVIPELGGLSSVTIPNLCDGLEFPGDGLFLRAPRDVGKLRLAITDVDLNVSMLGLPAALDGQVFEVQYHLKVGHTQAMFGGS